MLGFDDISDAGFTDGGGPVEVNSATSVRSSRGHGWCVFHLP